MNCLYCWAETDNGLALCALCQRKATVDMEFLPVYFRNLARWRPGRAGSRPVPGSRVLYSGERGSATGDRIGDALDGAANALSTWARDLAEDRVVEPPTADSEAEQVATLCQWLTEHLTTVATLEWCGEFVRDLDQHEATLRGLTETAVPGWYAGACARKISMESTCGAPTYVVPGLTWVTCGACGVTTYARDHLEAVLDEARDWVATPKSLAEAVVAMVDTEQSVESLRKRIAIWGNRGKLMACRPDGYAIKRYRLGAVLDLIALKGATRADLLPDEANAC